VSYECFWQIDSAHGSRAERTPVFRIFILGKNVDGRHTDGAADLNGFRPGDNFMAVGGRKEVDLEFDGDADLPFGKLARHGNASSLIRESYDHTAVEVSRELQQIIPPGKGKLDFARFEMNQANTRCLRETLMGNLLRKLWRI
jgi:hypothetical protein